MPLLLMRWFAALAGLAAVLGALVALSIPLALHMVDRRGEPIACGTGWHGDPAVARHEDVLNRQQHLLVGEQFVLTNYAAECDRLVADRRWLAAGVAGCGSALALTVLLVPILVAVRVDRRHARQSVSATGPNTGPVDPFTSAAW